MESTLSTVSIITTLFIGIFNLWYNIHNNNKTQFINTITASRITWIGEIRNEISRFIEFIPCNEINLSTILSASNEFEKSHLKKNAIDMSAIEKSACKVKLMLNPNSESDNNITECIGKMVEKVKQYRMLVLLGSSIRMNKKPNFSVVEKVEKEFLNKIVEGVKEYSSTNINIEDIEGIIFSYIDSDNVAEIIEVIEKVINNYIVPQLIDDRENLMIVVKDYLKDEWEKIKKESQKGIIKAMA